MNSKPRRSFYYGTSKRTQMRQLIADNDITNVTDFYSLLKDSSKIFKS